MKRLLILTTFLTIVSAATAQNGIPFTRDITGTPYRDYEETRGDYNYGDAYNCEIRYDSKEKGGMDLILYVNGLLYPEIETALVDEYVAYMESMNWNVVIKTISGGDEVDLRNTMSADFDALGYFYALFIGDLPVAWFDVDGDKAEGEFPCDLFYMDLDGEWRDDEYSDGIFDYHGDGSGDIEADIPFGRWTVSPLSFGGNTEKTLIENYIDKDLNYRQGGMTYEEGGLAYVDDDWGPWAEEWGNAVRTAFDDVEVIAGSYAEEDDYEGVRLPTSYEHMLVCVHSAPYVHTWNGSWAYPTYNTELYSIKSHSLSYNMFACSNARYTEPDYMCGWYAFMDNDKGVVCLGSTKTGSMLNFEDFYLPLGCGATYGESFRQWFADNAEHGVGDARAWFYGMSFIGDPTLKTIQYIAVYLSEFRGKPIENGVLLEWEYSDEGEDVGFNLYRRPMASDIKKSKYRIEAAEILLNDDLIVGESPIAYVDYSTALGTEYEYRLEMVVNNKVEDEATACVQTPPALKTTFGLTSVFPNPVKDEVSFEYVIPENSMGVLSVYDISGRKIYSVDLLDMRGIVKIDIDSSNFSAIADGLYITRLTAGDNIDVKKFVITR